jgi:hypothetical protein
MAKGQRRALCRDYLSRRGKVFIREESNVIRLAHVVLAIATVALTIFVLTTAIFLVAQWDAIARALAHP